MKKKRLVISVTCLLLMFMVGPVSANPTYLSDGLHLIADDRDYTYLGKLTTNPYDSDSIYNTYGTYGSKYSSTSIFNEYGNYGGKYSLYSPFNKYSVSPPMIINVTSDGISIVARLSINTYVPGSWDPDFLYQFLAYVGY